MINEKDETDEREMGENCKSDGIDDMNTGKWIYTFDRAKRRSEYD